MKQEYMNLKISNDGLNRLKSLLTIFNNDFGEEKIYFLSNMDKVKRETLYCLNDTLNVFNGILGRNLKLWIPKHYACDEEDEQYCELIRFGGYNVIRDADAILASDVIILKDDYGEQTLEYIIYENIKPLCKEITEYVNFCTNKLLHIGEYEKIKQINDEINCIIDYYWNQGCIDFDYSEMLNNTDMMEMI